jgi:hypothetical protein
VSGPIALNDSSNRFVQEALKPLEHVAETGEQPREDQVRHLPGGQWRLSHEQGSHSGLFDSEIRAGDNLLNHVATHRERRSDGSLILREEYAERTLQGELLGSREVVWESSDRDGMGGQKTRVLTESRFTSAKQFAISLPDGYQYGPNSPYREEE